MEVSISPPDGQQASPENRNNIAGFSAIIDPRLYANSQYDTTREQADEKSLRKLQYCGLNVDDLQKAHEWCHISPIRTVTDMYQILGYAEPPRNPGKDGKGWFTADSLTSLALPFPDPQRRGEVYPYTRIIRVRFPSPITVIVQDRKTNTFSKEIRKYGQPPKTPGGHQSSSEPYFLLRPDMWDKVKDVNATLYITESELKAVSLGLAGLAAIGFSGANAWGMSKGKKHQLNAALDPNGPWGKGQGIPIVGREIVVMFDTDASANALVIQSARNLAKALLTAGAKSVRIAKLPAVVREFAGTGPDDFLHHHLGDKWAGSSEKIARAKELIEEVASQAEIFHAFARYKAYSVVRTGERLYTRLSSPQSFAYYEVTTEGRDVRMRIYNGEEYLPYEISPGLSNTSGKMVVNDVELQRLARDGYEEGVNINTMEMGDDPDIPEMPSDFPQKVFAEVNRRLPRLPDNSVIDGVPGAAKPDKLIRVRNGIINVTKCFDTGVSWERRPEWLLPPSHHFISYGCLNLRLPNDDVTPECPHFIRMIWHGFDGDPERMDCLQQYMGKILLNPLLHNIQRMLCLYGEAGAGKSTLVEIISTIVGMANVAALRYASLGKHDTSTLPGKRLVVFSETGGDAERDRFCPAAASLIKSLTSKDPVSCEPKGRAMFTAYLNPEVILVSNDPPVIPMNRDAFRRRAVYLKWTNPIAKVDPDIPEIMKTTELPGIFLWALKGAADLIRLGNTGLQTPSHSEEDMVDLLEVVDPETQFVKTQIRKSKEEKAFLRNDEIQEHFREWAIIIRRTALQVSPHTIGRKIREVFRIKSVPHMVRGESKRGYVGLEFSDPKFRKLKETHGNANY